MSNINSESNRLKQLSGNDLKFFLKETFTKLVDEKIILRFDIDKNFNHCGFSYGKQYLANFIIETLDNKFIIINSSNSFRHDRMKTQAYDVNGVTNNAIISDKIIASILLYPDKELQNTGLITFRNKVITKDAYSPATHILVISEFIDFLEHHKNIVEEEKIEEYEKSENTTNQIKENMGGSYYGQRGNTFEKEVVAELNDIDNFKKFRLGTNDCSYYYSLIMNKLCTDNNITYNDIISITSSNAILKLRSGGNAKTDIIIKIKTIDKEIIETISVKNTTQNRVSCHDYKSKDFIRVLKIEDTKLASYLELYQENGSHKDFIDNMPENWSVSEFEKLLNPLKNKLLEWALTGKHDSDNLITPQLQISNYLLINKSGEGKFIDFSSYIDSLYASGIKLSYGLPLSWTYPSKQRGKRIQLKLPILV
ncbi:MspI family type II restriction endonuclease [Photobacterium phosphoreum]|uniref:MspI family type II restriction endonuclease n=1 Tax=Photobacterium phosphoreum TaxID=659 RepID=UPI00242AF1CE|nr:MspI family type II restriction endonuclease [Photobacterium phosphoreum]